MCAVNVKESFVYLVENNGEYMLRLREEFDKMTLVKIVDLPESLVFKNTDDREAEILKQANEEVDSRQGYGYFDVTKGAGADSDSDSETAEEM